VECYSNPNTNPNTGSGINNNPRSGINHNSSTKDNASPDACHHWY
jgi:hypothetical protein